MEEENVKLLDKNSAVTPFSINDILSHRCKDSEDLLEKPLDMSKANKDSGILNCCYFIYN